MLDREERRFDEHIRPRRPDARHQRGAGDFAAGPACHHAGVHAAFTRGPGRGGYQRTPQGTDRAGQGLAREDQLRLRQRLELRPRDAELPSESDDGQAFGAAGGLLAVSALAGCGGGSPDSSASGAADNQARAVGQQPAITLDGLDFWVGEVGPSGATAYSGPQQQPFICRTLESGLGQPEVDNQEGIGQPVFAVPGNINSPIVGYSSTCSVKTRLAYYYWNGADLKKRIDGGVTGKDLEVQILIGLLISFGWWLFVWSWQRVTADRPELGELRLLMIAAVLVVPVLGLLWAGLAAPMSLPSSAEYCRCSAVSSSPG